MEEDYKKPTRLFIVDSQGKETEITEVVECSIGDFVSHNEHVGTIIYKDVLYNIYFDFRDETFSLYKTDNELIIKGEHSVLNLLINHFGMEEGEFLYSNLLHNEEESPRLSGRQRFLFVSCFNKEYSTTYNRTYAEWLHVYYYCRVNKLSPFTRFYYQLGKDSFKSFCGGI